MKLVSSKAAAVLLVVFGAVHRSSAGAAENLHGPRRQQRTLQEGCATIADPFLSYHIRARHSGLVLAAEDSFAEGASIMQMPMSEDNEWKLRPQPDSGYYHILNAASDYALNILWGSTESGASIIQWAEEPVANENWCLQPTGEGNYYYIISQYTGQAIDVAGGNTEQGANVVQWPLQYSSNQQFEIVPVAECDVMDPSKRYTLTARFSSLALSTSAKGAQITQESVTGGIYQQWTVKPQTMGYNHVVSVASGHALNVAGASLENGARVVSWDESAGINDNWCFRAVGDYYEIISQHSGQLLDVAQNSIAEGGGVTQWSSTGFWNQQWRLREAQAEIPAGACVEEPLQVYILMGQSNMVGLGAMRHLEQLLGDQTTRQRYMHLFDPNANDWAESENVHVSYNRRGDERSGKLKADEFGSSEGEFGPELEFGFTMERAQCGCDNLILIIKSATGGANLAEDFRPPRSGGRTGDIYNNVLREIRHTFDLLGTEYVPDYNADLGYEIKGLVYFQGFNDIFEPQFYNEYAQNLINLIMDMRDELEVPDLPVVVGETGMHGFDSDAFDFNGALAVRAAQREAVDFFGDDVVYVPTAQFINTDDTTYDFEYHYFGRADIFFNIGEAFGKAMLQMLGKSTTCD